MLSFIIVVITVAVLLIVLNKLGVLKTTKKIAYVYKHTGNELTVTYKRFTGPEFYNFMLGKNSTITISYDVHVEEGELTLEWTERKRLIWRETFRSDSRGSFTAQTGHRLHCVKLEGKDTRGGCHVVLTQHQVYDT